MSSIHMSRHHTNHAQVRMSPAPSRQFVHRAVTATTVFTLGVLVACVVAAIDHGRGDAWLARTLPAAVTFCAGLSFLAGRLLRRRPALIVTVTAVLCAACAVRFAVG